jgi:hypothetical protein
MRSLERGLRWFFCGFTAVAACALIAACATGADKPAKANEQTAKKPQKAPAATINAADYPNLQAAFDAVPERGGLVVLPPGQFRLTEPLVLSRGETRVVGAGAATCLVNCNTEGKPAMIIEPPGLDKNPKAELWRVQLADFRVKGDPDALDAKSSEPKSGDGIVARRIQELYVHGLSIDHCGGHGLLLDRCYEDPRVSDSIFTYNRGAGVHILAGHDIVVNANHFEENTDALHCIDSFNLCMNGNNLDDHLQHGVVIENTYGSVLSGNMIEECQGTAVVLDRDCYGITISANVIAHEFGGGVDLRDAWGCTVSANTFVLVAVHSLAIGPKSGRITVTGNTFTDSNIGQTTRRKGEKNWATGIYLDSTTDIVISGNTFSGLDKQAVKSKGTCTRLAITGNLMLDLNKKTDEKAPALNLGETKDSRIENNLFQQGLKPR